MSRSKKRRKNDDREEQLTWSPELGGFVPEDGTTDAAALMREEAAAELDEFPPLDADLRATADASWEAYGRSIDEVRTGDALDDFDAINKAAAKDVTKGFIRDAHAKGYCPWCGSDMLVRRIVGDGDVVVACERCKREAVDTGFDAPKKPSPRMAQGPSLSDLAAGRYGARAEGKGLGVGRGSQGSLFGDDRSRGFNHDWYRDGGGYSGYSGWIGTPMPPRELRTSASHPLLVDFVPQEVHARAGRLGMTFAPGKKHSGFGSDHARDLDTDLARLKELGTTTLVCLIEDHEFKSLQIPDLLERAQTAGIATHWYPIRDSGVPHDTETFLDLVNAILDEMEAGRTVVVHCKGGLGRTGTVVAAVLVALGWEPKAAVDHTRKARKGTLENKTQEVYVEWVDSCFE